MHYRLAKQLALQERRWRHRVYRVHSVHLVLAVIDSSYRPGYSRCYLELGGVMAVGVEARVPLLDLDLVNRAAG